MLIRRKTREILATFQKSYETAVCYILLSHNVSGLDRKADPRYKMPR